MPRIELTKHKQVAPAQKLLSFPTKEFKKVEHNDNDGQRSEGLVVKQDKLSGEIISGLNKVTRPNERVQEIKPLNGKNQTGQEINQNQEQPEKKFNFLEQYRDGEVPEDYCLIGIDANGDEKLILGDVAAIDAMDDDPNMWVFVDAQTRSQMIVNRHEIHDIRPDTGTHYRYVETDTTGNQKVYQGYLSKVLNGRCFFERTDNQEIMLIDSKKVFSTKSMKSVKEIYFEETDNQVEIEKPREKEAEQEKPFDYRAELTNRLNFVAISGSPQTKQQKFIEIGKTKAMILEMKDEEKNIEDSMADFFVNKSARDLMSLLNCGMFKYFEKDSHQELEYANIYEKFASVKNDWLLVSQKMKALYQEKMKVNSFQVRESRHRHITRKETELLAQRTSVLERMNFIKKQVNKLNYLKQFDQSLRERLEESGNRTSKTYYSKLNNEERIIVSRHINQFIRSKYSSQELEKYLENKLDSVVGEIKLVRRINQGGIGGVLSDIWQGIKISFDHFDDKLSRIINKPIFSPKKPHQKTWWQRTKSWFGG